MKCSYLHELLTTRLKISLFYSRDEWLIIIYLINQLRLSNEYNIIEYIEVE